MALHRKLSGADVHTPYRWTVADETERMAITTNPDGSTITADNGLRAKLFQIDTNTEYVCTAIDPVFTAVSGGSSSSTAMTAAEIKSAYESNTNTNAYTDADKTKLASVEANATADQTGTEIVSAIDTELGQTDWKTGGTSSGGGGFDYTETTDPLITTNPTAAGATWINEARGEIFVCADNTPDANHWVGQLGTVVQPISIQTPTAVSPTDGTTDVVETPTLTADAFTCVGGTDTHASSSWQVFSDIGLTTVVYESLNDASNLESITIPAGRLAAGIQHYWRVEYTGTIYGDSSYSAVVSFTTADVSISVGTVMSDGGIVACQHDGYWLVVAPATQRGTSIKWGLYGIDTSLTAITAAATPDPQDGKLNTDVLTSSTYNTINDGQGSVGAPAAEFCRAISADWFLPNKEELIAIRAVAADIDAADTSGGTDTFASMDMQFIWSSTERSGDISWVVRVGDDYIIDYYRYHDVWVVPVRRIAI